MRIGASLLVIAIGAILKFAITRTVTGVDLGVIGIILMAVGAAGLLITLIWMSTRRRTDVIQHAVGGTVETTYLTPNDDAERHV